MFKYTHVPAVRFDIPGWPGFYALIISNADDTLRRIYLTHDNFGVIQELWGACQQADGTMEAIEETIKTVWACITDYLPDYVASVCQEE